MATAIAPVPRTAAQEENRSKWLTLGAMCFALFMMMLDNTVVNVALPSINGFLFNLEGSKIAHRDLKFAGNFKFQGVFITRCLSQNGKL